LFVIDHRFVKKRERDDATDQTLTGKGSFAAAGKILCPKERCIVCGSCAISVSEAPLFSCESHASPNFLREESILFQDNKTEAEFFLCYMEEVKKLFSFLAEMNLGQTRNGA
jgi:hypothetical protein